MEDRLAELLDDLVGVRGDECALDGGGRDLLLGRLAVPRLYLLLLLAAVGDEVWIVPQVLRDDRSDSLKAVGREVEPVLGVVDDALAGRDLLESCPRLTPLGQGLIALREQGVRLVEADHRDALCRGRELGDELLDGVDVLRRDDLPRELTGGLGRDAALDELVGEVGLLLRDRVIVLRAERGGLLEVELSDLLLEFLVAVLGARQLLGDRGLALRVVRVVGLDLLDLLTVAFGEIAELLRLGP